MKDDLIRLLELARKKPKAVIFDVDGTLSSMAWRVPYLTFPGWDSTKRWGAFHGGMVLDTPNPAMVGAARAYKEQGYHVIMLTLRPERYRKHTETWFREHGIPFDDLLLRPTGDYVEGQVRKRQIYEDQIKPHYDVHMTFDDYPVMNDMWTSANVPTTRVFDPGSKPLAGLPAVDPRVEVNQEHVSVPGAPLETHVGSAYTSGDGLRHGGSVTDRGHLDLGDLHLRAWIPPHASQTHEGKPYRVKGHWRKLNGRVGLAADGDAAREVLWMRLRGEGGEGSRSRPRLPRVQDAVRHRAGQMPLS